MSATISVLYVTQDDKHAERFGFANEQAARACAHRYVLDGYRDVVVRATVQDGHITTTLWAEPFNPPDNETPITHDANPWKDALDDLIVYTIPEILTMIQRATIHGQTLTTDWFEDQLIGIDRDLSAIA